MHKEVTECLTVSSCNFPEILQRFLAQIVGRVELAMQLTITSEYGKVY
jgi:hypothetical protein